MHATRDMMALESGSQDGSRPIDILRPAVRASGGKCLLVVDPSLRELEDNPAEGAFFSHARSTVIPVTHTAFPPASQPRLVELDTSTEAGAALFAESIRVALADRQPESIARGQGQRIGGWLLGAETAQEVADHWALDLLQTDDQGRRCVLRFYDARVLALVWPVLEPMQRRHLLGSIHTWFALDASAELTAYTAPGRSQSQLALSDEQWVELQRNGTVNRALALFMHSVGRQPREKEVRAAVDSAARADRHGLRDPDDKIAFVGHALGWHSNFDSHPAMASVLEKVRHGVLYSAAASELESRVVMDIQRGAWFTPQ